MPDLNYGILHEKELIPDTAWATENQRPDSPKA